MLVVLPSSLPPKDRGPDGLSQSPALLLELPPSRTFAGSPETVHDVAPQGPWSLSFPGLNLPRLPPLGSPCWLLPAGSGSPASRRPVATVCLSHSSRSGPWLLSQTGSSWGQGLALRAVPSEPSQEAGTGPVGQVRECETVCRLISREPGCWRQASACGVLFFPFAQFGGSPSVSCDFSCDSY